MRMEAYKLSAREVLRRVGGSESGLSSDEAAERLKRNGPNALPAPKKKSKLALFFAQFKDLMTIILIAAAVLSGILAAVTGEMSELVDTGILLAIIVLNALVGFLQQFRADAAIEHLKKLSRCEAKAVRDGRVVKIDAEGLVVGDIVEVEEGDRIPADLRILSSEDFSCDESALTGESRPVRKGDCVLSEGALATRKNSAFSSTFCVKGHARCVVVGCGKDTETGKIADLLEQSGEQPSPLDKMIAKLGKVITVSVLAVAAVLFMGKILSGRAGILDSIMAAVAVAVAAIPEGMGAVVTVILAVGVQRMAKRGAVMRKLSAVEALGSCTVLCSDKTGTLTKNRMTVEAVDACFADAEAGEELLACMRVCHSVKGHAGGYLGDPTEVALLEYADGQNFELNFRAVGGTPFSSERKRMSVLARLQNRDVLYVKGGYDVLLKLCTKRLSGKNEVPMSEDDRAKILSRAGSYAMQAMRVLAFARGEKKEENLTFLGIAALFDPPKEGTKEAVSLAKAAQVRPVMITGDSPETALAVARRLGIAKGPSEVVTGEQIDRMGSDFEAHAGEYSVYARVAPVHKVQIVSALKARGEVVAMTGDGINDAPALKAADVGVAMGSGTDVTKNAADVVIGDDDFSTMVHAVEEGRGVFLNIKRTISFFLSTNLAEVLGVLLVSLFFWRYDFLTSTQLLWVNLITDSLPVLALGVERSEGTMSRGPVSDSEIFSPKSLLKVVLFGLLMTAILIFSFVTSLHVWGNAVAGTVAFVLLSNLELFHAFNVRAEDRGKVFSNRVLWITVAVGILLSVLLVATPLAPFFALTPLTLPQWAFVGCMSLLILPLGALVRLFGRVRMRKTYTLSRETGR